MGDETMLREFPPLRASWSRRGEQKRVVVSGRNPYRVLLGALNAVTGQLVRLVRERCRTADTQAFVEELGRVRPQVPKLLIWDNAPPHHPKLVQQAAQEAHIQIAFLPFRAPELMPCEDLWRQLKAVAPIASMPISPSWWSVPSPGWMRFRRRIAYAERASPPLNSSGYPLT